MICEDGKIAQAKEMLVRKFIQEEMYTSDVDPLRTMRKFSLIARDLISGKMPDKNLPLDIHVIEYSKFVNILKEAPRVIENAIKNDTVPYLPIHPHSLRKK